MSKKEADRTLAAYIEKKASLLRGLESQFRAWEIFLTYAQIVGIEPTFLIPFHRFDFLLKCLNIHGEVVEVKVEVKSSQDGIDAFLERQRNDRDLNGVIAINFGYLENGKLRKPGAIKNGMRGQFRAKGVKLVEPARRNKLKK